MTDRGPREVVSNHSFGFPPSDVPLAETDGLAALGRCAFLVTIIALLWASFGHPPRVFVSFHTEHFAAFYLLSFTCAMAVKRRPLMAIGYTLLAFAVVVEAVRTLLVRGFDKTYLDAIADIAGVIAALGPMLGQRFRERF